MNPHRRARWLAAAMILLAVSPCVRPDDKVEDRKGRFLRVANPTTIGVMRFNREFFFVLLGVRPALGLSRSDPLEREATAFLTSLLQDKRLILKLDSAGPIQDEVRTYTGYVELEDGTGLNEEMLRRGYGTVDDRVSFSRLVEFRTYEREARDQERGIWKTRSNFETAVKSPPCMDGTVAYSGTCGVTNPEIIPDSKITPEYPRKARRKKIEGRVVLRAVVSKGGNVRDVVPITSPDTALTQAAIDAVEQWKYRPALKDGEPVDAYFTVVVEFFLSRGLW